MLPALLACAVASLPLVFGDVIVYKEDFPHFITNEFPDVQASFGGDLSDNGLKGMLTVGEPENGCGALKPPPPYNSTYKWIVLIARNNCSFEVKIRNAQEAGYDCAIVHNVDSNDLETMSAKDPTGIIIPSVFVGSDAGDKLRECTYDAMYYLVVNGETPFDINTHLLLPFAIIVALCLMVMVIFMFVKCLTDRARARRHRLPRRSLKKIPTCKFSKGDPYDMCAICLDEYQDGERLRVLPCAHAYHAKCIDPWLTQNRRVCPVCKRRVVAAGERPHSDSDSDDSRQPLVRDDTHTQGGTFEPQRENPFVRAARFMSRLRARPHSTDTEEAAPNGEEGDPNGNDEDDADSADTRPLLPSTVTSQSERRRTRPRRASRRSSRRAHSATPPLPPAPYPAPPPALARSAEHSINTDEIGVAAIPAPSSLRTHVDL